MAERKAIVLTYLQLVEKAVRLKAKVKSEAIKTTTRRLVKKVLKRGGMAAVNDSPLETSEQATVVEYLELIGAKYTAIPNSTYTKSWSQKRKNHQQGLRAGFPDLVAIVDGTFIVIEMKRRKGGSVSAEQKSWIEALKLANIPVAVAKGADEAIDFINSFRQSTGVKRDKTPF